MSEKQTKYKILQTIAWGGKRYEKGQEYYLDADTAERFRSYIKRVQGSQSPGHDEPQESTEGGDVAGQEEVKEQDPDNYDAYAYGELQAEAKERGLSASGSAEALKERLREDDAEKAEGENSEGDDAEEAE